MKNLLRATLIWTWLVTQVLAAGTTPTHLVIIIKENRSYDQLLGASIGTGTTTATDSGGNTVTLWNPPNTFSSKDCSHTNSAANSDINGGSMNKFNLNCPFICTSGTATLGTSCSCSAGHGQCSDVSDCGTGGVCSSDTYEQYTASAMSLSSTSGYYPWAVLYGVADHFYSSILGPSFPAHQYFVTSAPPNGAVENPNSVWGVLSTHTGSSWPYTYTVPFAKALCSGAGAPVAGCASAGQIFWGGVCAASSSTPCSCVQANGNTSCSDATDCGGVNSTCYVGSSNPSGAQEIGGNPGAYGSSLSVTTMMQELEGATTSGGSTSNPVSWTIYAPAADQGSNGVEWNIGQYSAWTYLNRWFDNTTCNTPTLACCEPPNWGLVIGGSAPGGGTVTFVGKVVDWHCFDYDVANGYLPSVSWLIPTLAYNEHPGSSMQAGMNWTASRLQNIFNTNVGTCTSGSTTLYCNTIALTTWDDWGGFYDHINPIPINQDIYGPGIRVALLCVNPYCNNAVNTTTFEFASINKGIENSMMVWLGRNPLTALSARDTAATDILASMISLSNTPIPPPGGGLAILGTQLDGGEYTSGSQIQ